MSIIILDHYNFDLSRLFDVGALSAAQARANENWNVCRCWINRMKAALKLDAVDLRILEAVQENARITKLALAEKVGLSATPCWLRLRKLEEAGIVTGYHARIAYRKIAPIAHVIVQITLGNHRQSDFDRFERAVTVVPEIVSCWSVGGGVDYFLMIVARDIDGYQRLIDRLLDQNIGIERYFTYIVTKLVKDEKASAPLSLFKEVAD